MIAYHGKSPNHKIMLSLNIHFFPLYQGNMWLVYYGLPSSCPLRAQNVFCDQLLHLQEISKIF